MDVAKEALLAHQAALYVTGNNIANANTLGYSRQRVTLEAVDPMMSHVGPVGRGVRATGVERLYDCFISAQLTLEKQQLGKWRAWEEVCLRVQQTLSLLSTQMPGPALSEFFNAFEDLANNPSGSIERQAVLAAGSALASSFQRIHGSLDQLRRDLNNEIAQVVNDSNLLAQQIADLNIKIMVMESGFGAANDLRDRRDLLLDELAENIGFHHFLDDQGLENIFLESGHLLVERGTLGSLGVKEDAGNDGLYGLLFVDANGNEYNITEHITGGRLGALLAVRDGQLVSYMDDVDTLARSVIEEVNALHILGRGLADFSTLTSANGFGTGHARNKFQLFQLFVPDLGKFVTDSLGASSTTTITILDGLTDSLNELQAVIDATLNLSATVVGGALEITADAGYTFYFSNDTSGLLRGLGLNVFFAGGDSSDIALAPSVAADVANVAAARSSAPGDNSNALAIADLRESPVVNGSSTFGEFYSTLIGRTGMDARAAAGNREEAESIVNQLVIAKASASGVFIDEELANLLMIEKAFQAAARLITISDELLEDLIRLVS